MRSNWVCARQGSSASTRGIRWNAPAFGSAPFPRPTRGSTPTASGRHLYLGFVIEAEGRRLYHSGDTLAYPGLVERLGSEPFDVLFLPINGRDPARGVPGNMTAAEAVDLAAAGPPAVCRAASLRYVYLQYGARRRFLKPRRAGFPRGSSRAFCRAASAGRSCREHHAGNRHRNVRQPRRSRSTTRGRSWHRRRPSIRAIIRGRAGPSKTRSSGGTRPRKRSSRS